MADEWICPITQELPVDPVMAEDGRFYDERRSIEQWFKTVPGAMVNSPVVNMPMVTGLKVGPQVQNTIRILIGSGVISGAKADA